MGNLSKILQERDQDPEAKVQRYIWTPFKADQDLAYELRNWWRTHGYAEIYEDKHWTLAISSQAVESVLYILGHSGRSVSVLADSKGNTKTAQELVDCLTANVPGTTQCRLPPKILAIKIWACFTGVNGFAQQFKNLLLAKQKGHNPLVIGYNEGLGHPCDTGDKKDKQKHVWQLLPGGKRGDMIGRASAHRTQF